MSKLNCEVLNNDLAFEVRWAVAGESIVVQLVAKLDENEYMSFGISGDDTKTKMKGGDVVVAWVDKTTLKGYAEDYFLADKAQCSGPTGSCPDNRLSENTNSIRLLNTAMVNGYSIVTYQRSLKASDKYDKPILTNLSQPIIWAVGPLNQRREVSFHTHYLKENHFIHFGRPAKWNCPMPQALQPAVKTLNRNDDQIEIEEVEQTTTTTTTHAPSRSRNNERRRGSNNRRKENAEQQERTVTNERKQTRRRGPQRASSTNAVRRVPTPAPVQKHNKPWVIPAIECDEPEDGVFFAQMGPTGGKRGYPAITGHVGWGLCWYINGLLIPQINVVRGKTYTFYSEAGDNPDIPAKFHPFYITDDPVGGYEHKTPEERKNITIFAGVDVDDRGNVVPHGVGRWCSWDPQGDEDPDDFDSFGAYQRTLQLKCDEGVPGIVEWTPDKNTPDTVYYQCFTHRYLGWKINVLDSCDAQGAASENEPVVVPAPEGIESLEKLLGDLEGSPSIQVETKVAPPQKIMEDRNSELSPGDLEAMPSSRVETRVNPNQIVTEAKGDNDQSKSTGSEASSTSSIDSLLENAQFEQPQSTTDPILIQTQQNYDIPLFFSTGPLFAQSLYNPYAFENPYSNLNQHNFKSSLSLATTEEDNKPDNISSSTTTEMTTSSTTTTTLASITTTTTTNATTLPLTDKLIAQASNTKQINSVFTNNPPLKPINQKPPFKYRRPGPNVYPHPVPIRPLPRKPMRPHPGMMFRGPPPHFMLKKPIYKPLLKQQSINRPVVVPYPPKIIKPVFVPLPHKKHHPYMGLRQPLILPKQKLTNKTPVPDKVIVPNVKNVEISPQQASTEKEPELQTVKPSTLLATKKPNVPVVKEAINTGFHPESIVIETGFKPILSKIEDRIDENEGPELEYESEIGVINVEDEEKSEEKQTELFEPIFVPSPLDKIIEEKSKLSKKPPKKTHFNYDILKHRNTRENYDLEDPIPEANEKVQTYYLPPVGQSARPAITVQEPSNIDFEVPIASEDKTDVNFGSPPDVVVTYDGKRVSGASLTKLSDRSGLDLQSKLADSIRGRPQFVPFKGELPPLLNTEFISKNMPQLQSQGLLSRDLDTPNLPEYSGGPTKLTRVYERDTPTNTSQREKREAHHTPEHTAEQERMKSEANSNSNSTTTNSATQLSSYSIFYFNFVLVIMCFLRSF